MARGGVGEKSRGLRDGVARWTMEGGDPRCLSAAGRVSDPQLSSAIESERQRARERVYVSWRCIYIYTYRDGG